MPTLSILSAPPLFIQAKWENSESDWPANSPLSKKKFSKLFHFGQWLPRHVIQQVLYSIVYYCFKVHITVRWKWMAHQSINSSILTSAHKLSPLQLFHSIDCRTFGVRHLGPPSSSWAIAFSGVPFLSFQHDESHYNLTYQYPEHSGPIFPTVKLLPLYQFLVQNNVHFGPPTSLEAKHY